jgi:hypothetical protein
LAPEVGFFWTPGYWGWGGAAFLWHEGFWGPVVGFYGGINYGFGYFGTSFVGGRWDNGHFFYNRAVLNVNVNVIHNVYNTRVDIHNDVRVSYNGGRGGIDARPTPQEEAAERERHIGPVAAQTQHIQEARSNPQLRASANHGRPPIAATARPGDFKTGVVAAREGSYKAEPAGRAEAGGRTEPGRPEANSGRPNAVHPNDLPPVERPAAPNTGNPKLDQKYQKQQDKLMAKQNQDRQKLQAQQEKEHQQPEKQHASDQARQQMEQRHAQQTQRMVQQHTQQRQQMELRQAPRSTPRR